MSLHSDFVPLSPYEGVFSLSPPFVLNPLPASTVPATGVLDVAVPLNDLPLGLQALDALVQPVFSGGAAFRVATPTVMTFLDGAL